MRERKKKAHFIVPSFISVVLIPQACAALRAHKPSFSLFYPHFAEKDAEGGRNGKGIKEGTGLWWGNKDIEVHKEEINIM